MGIPQHEMFAWTDERVEQLRALVADPRKLSATSIGAEMGVSRNSVIGKVHRLKLELPLKQKDGPARRPAGSPRRPRATLARLGPRPDTPRGKPIIRKRRSHHAAGGKVMIVTEYELPPPVVVPVEPLNIPLLDLTESMCRFPIGESAPFFFCGHPKFDGLPYCEAHALVCYRPMESREKRAAEVAMERKAA